MSEPMDLMNLQPFQRDILERLVAQEKEAGRLPPGATVRLADPDDPFTKMMEPDGVQGLTGKGATLVIVDDPAAAPEMTAMEAAIHLKNADPLGHLREAMTLAHLERLELDGDPALASYDFQGLTEKLSPPAGPAAPPNRHQRRRAAKKERSR